MVDRFMTSGLFPPEWQTVPLLWHLCGCLLVSMLWLLNRRAHASHVVILCLTQLPGVILHETAHLLVGLLLRAEPCSLSLIPERSQGGWRLGSVQFRSITPLNAVPIALAPLALLPLACYLFRYWFIWFPATLANTLLLYGTLFLLLYNAIPSRQDLRVACNWRSLLLYGGIGALLFSLRFAIEQ